MKKNIKRILAAALASVLLFTDCASGFAAEVNTDSGIELENESQDSEQIISETMQEDFVEETVVEGEPAAVLFEMEELREQSAKHYRLSDGTVLAAQYGMDVHYEDADGAWEEIDNRFLYEEAEDAEDFDGFRSAEGDVEFKFAPQVDEGELVKITQDEYSVGFELLPSVSAETYGLRNGEAVEETEISQAPITFLQGDVLNAEEIPQELLAVPAVMSLEEDTEVIWADVSSGVPEEEERERMDSVKVENAVTAVGYGNVLPGVSLQYVMAGSSLKEYILVNEKSDSYSYDFSMNLENLEPEMQEDGSILLKDAETGDAVYEIPAGYMTDAAGECSDAVSMEVVENEEGGWILNVTADATWINDEERVLPVQIDPTLNGFLHSNTNLIGSYASLGYSKTSYKGYPDLMIGYDSGGSKQLETFMQIRNLPVLPKNSVICGAVCHFYVKDFSHINNPEMFVRAKEIENNTTWEPEFTWGSRPQVSSVVLDYRQVDDNLENTYVGWNLTGLVKEHYKKGNGSGIISGFSLETYGGSKMNNQKCAKLVLRQRNTDYYPILQVIYRDTKGVEGYYTYQTHDVGNAGTVYLGDYNGQMTLIRPVASYESSIMSYGLSLVYNSSFSDKYFTYDKENLHTKNYTNMKMGHGWKLSAQETVVSLELKNIDQWGNEVCTDWLVYNDGDGTEHYFKQSESNTSKYEDEDGLGLTITKNGSDYTMTDGKDNQKYFKNGYLTKIVDANGNAVHIIYNGGTVSENVPSGNSEDQITSVCIDPRGDSLDAETVFELTYENNLLIKIKEIYGNTHKIEYMTDGNGDYQLKRIKSYDSVAPEFVETARYGYGSGPYALRYVFDVDADRGMYYNYVKSATGYRINHFYEYADSDNGQLSGRKVNAFQDELRKTLYRDFGADRVAANADTPDDILTTYLFDSFGHTVNVSSRDQNGNLLGVTASAYGENSGTSRKNNRITSSIAGGQSGANLLIKGGFEKYTGTTANSWNHSVSGETVKCVQTSPRSGESCYELYNSDTSQVQGMLQSVTLVAGKTYTASVYVNTSGAEAFADGGGAYLSVLESESSQNSEIAKGTMLQYRTDPEIEGGWQRISVTFTTSVEGSYCICLVWQNAKGTLRADDTQLEEGEAPSSYNHVYNGSFEIGENAGWTETYENVFQDSGEYLYGSESCKMNGYPGTRLNISQRIPLNKSSDTTFLLSGWSKGNSVPDLDKSYEISKMGNSTQEKNITEKFWGISVQLVYTDGVKEDHFLSFNEYVTDWQHASMELVPKETDKTIRYADMRVCYFNNANAAYFDNISLTEEPVQTYKYNEDGDIVSVKSTGNGEETYSYNSNTQNLMSVGTEGSGSYTYQYENTINKHLPTSITNDTVTMDIVYDANGQAAKTSLKNSQDTWKMESSAVYGSTVADQGLLISQTDNTGATMQYTYNNRRQVSAVKNANEQEIKTYYEDVLERPVLVYQNGVASAGYEYAGGNLQKINRSGYTAANGSRKEQIYRFTYDDFGNRTGAYVGNRQLAVYSYSDGNGNLRGMSYGPSAASVGKISYEYDNLERLKAMTYRTGSGDESVRYGYRYSADGNLAGITENGNLKYTYEYDSLGRLIYSSRLNNNGSTVLFTQHQYDTSDRLTKQSWQIGADAFSENYTYSTADGTLATMTTGGDNLGFIYNNLKQLSKRTSPKLDVSYSYRTRDAANNLTTNQVETLQYLRPGTEEQLLPTLKYTYDSIGNITKVEEGTEAAAQYTYDTQSQLTQAVLQGQTSDYVYDTYGNIRSKTNSYSNGTTESYSYSYGNTEWLDLLTELSYTDREGNNTVAQLTYDIVGNPLSYFNGKSNWNFTWKYGRQLVSAESGNMTITNTYDVDGIRGSKTVRIKQDGTEDKVTTYSYTYLGEKLAREVIGSSTVIDYFYDNDGRPYKLVIKEGTDTYTGYFVLNLQGDVIAIVDSEGLIAVEYEYDAWGKEISHTISGDDGSKLYQYNALKYRGYYYDAETGFYYVSSRYYDPEICRFINADTIELVLASQTTLTDKNLYAYCDNNPIVRVDFDGDFWNVVIGATVGGAVSAITTAIDSYMTTGNIDWTKVGVSATVGAISGGIAATGFSALVQANITATVSAVGSVATDLHNRKMSDASKITLKEAGGIVARAVGSAAIGFGSSIYGSAVGKVLTDNLQSQGTSMLFRGKVGAGCYSKAQARNMMQQGKKLINLARGISSVAGTIITWPTSTALSATLY